MKKQIKNSNDMLGLIIKNANIENQCSHTILQPASGHDWESYSTLLRQLESTKYIDFDSEGMHLYTLGRQNYISAQDNFISWIIAFLKFAISYTLGIFSGIIAAWIMLKLGIE